ncbi:MAG: phage integrase SAM-like domain-containing protein [Phocaeicola sp.]
MRTIKTYLRTYSNPESGVIWVSFYVRREKIHFSTKVEVLKKHWNDNKCSISPADKKSADKNLIIDTVLSRINNVFVKYRLRDKELSKDLFMREYNRPSDYKTFYEFVEDYMKKNSRQVENTTLDTQISVINKMKTYSPDLYFDDINKDWLDIYFSYLRKDLGNNANTAYKNMAVLRKYVKAATTAGYITENPFNDWSIKKGTASCTYLDEEELGRLVNIYHTGELEYKQHKTLEFFLFMCFSSLHIGDAKQIKLEQIGDDTFTYFRLKNRNSKPSPILIPISQPLRRIINLITGTRKKGPLFEVLPAAEQTMNRILKEIAVIADIDKNITHKVARHTFATIFLKNSKDLAALKELLGHSEMKETLVYAHVMDESKRDGVQCFNSFIF